jgi:hypothetical protein
MVKKNKKKPYSFSFSPKLIDKLHHYKNTHPDNKLSQEVEHYLDGLIPEIE